MSYNFKDNVRLFMIFDILGDTLRSGPLEWAVSRKRLEDVKNHVFDLVVMYRLLERYLPSDLDGMKMIDYMIVHDLPEALTGDITKFEGVSDEERERVNNIAIDFLIRTFNDVLDFRKLLLGFESKKDIEAKIVSMLDAVSSAVTFLKYECEGDIDMNNPSIIPELKPYIDYAKSAGIDIGDVFYEYHRKRINFTDEECKKYKIERMEANYIAEVIAGFLDEFYSQKKDASLITVSEIFPESAAVHKKF